MTINFHKTYGHNCGTIERRRVLSIRIAVTGNVPESIATTTGWSTSLLLVQELLVARGQQSRGSKEPSGCCKRLHFRLLDHRFMTTRRTKAEFVVGCWIQELREVFTDGK